MAEPRWLDDDQQQAWRKFVAVVTKLPAALDTQLQRDAGVTHFGYFVLVLLSEAPERTMRLNQLAARANSSLSRLSHVLTRLEDEGWIRRDRAPDTRRGNVAVLTDAGWEKVVAIAPGHVEIVQQLVFDGLTPTQVQQLYELSAVLLERIEAPR
jgi:DNA-binding MarR family transcriptional regulator